MMVDRKRVLRVLGVLVIAGGTGHLMQNGGAVAARVAPEAPALATGPMTQVLVLPAPFEGESRGLSQVPGAGESGPRYAAPRRLGEPEVVRLAALDTRNDASPDPLPAPRAASGCEARLDASTESAALVRLTLTAPCHPQARVELRHELLEIVAFTDAAGQLVAVIPALAVTAEFTALLDGLPPVAAAAEVAALADYHRVAITWAGAGDLELHAFENGADYGGKGHVWHGAPGDPAQGGFAMRLGHPDDPVPVMADIYSFPATAGSVRLTVESLVDRDSCGLDIAGHAVQVSQGSGAEPVQIVLSMPQCNAAGGYLVLDNVFPDLQVAAR